MVRLLFLAATLAFGAGAGFCQDLLRMGISAQEAPFSFLSDAGGVDGFARDLGDELCKRAGRSCEWINQPSDDPHSGLTGAAYDVLIAHLQVPETPAEGVIFGQAYLPPVPSAYIALTSSVDPTIDKVATVGGSPEAAYLTDKGRTPESYATLDDALAALTAGDVAVVFVQKPQLAALLGQSGGNLVYVGDAPVLRAGVSLGFRQGDGALMQAFDDAIVAMKADGSLNAMIVKWFGSEATLW